MAEKKKESVVPPHPLLHFLTTSYRIFGGNVVSGGSERKCALDFKYFTYVVSLFLSLRYMYIIYFFLFVSFYFPYTLVYCIAHPVITPSPIILFLYRNCLLSYMKKLKQIEWMQILDYATFRQWPAFLINVRIV